MYIDGGGPNISKVKHEETMSCVYLITDRNSCRDHMYLRSWQKAVNIPLIRARCPLLKQTDVNTVLRTTLDRSLQMKQSVVDLVSVL